MIDFLQGKLVSKSPGSVTVQVGGIGLRVRVPLSTYEALPGVGRQAVLLTHLHVREDELSLYGFATELERDLFKMLLGVSKIGPVVAMGVLSSCLPAQFKRYILDEDVDALRTMVKGIGTKTARRLIVELQGAMKHLAVEPLAAPAGQAARDAVQALVALGESRVAAERSVQAALEKLGPDADRQKLMEEALSQ
ncbi:MAG: Holliday junction branch migration protein RuvA [Candidatus Brocadiae bacterium]|nr:Holliday junction branch migration protein RuvA [Candidatus Brocadiia bacterium]